MKRFLPIILLSLLILSSCNNETISQNELEQDKFDIKTNYFNGSFNTIVYETDSPENYYDMRAHQIDSNHIIIWTLNYNNSITNILYLYDLSSEQILKKFDLNNNRVIRVCNDKIIIGNQEVFYTVDFNLEVTSDKIALPTIMFKDMNNYEYPDKWIQYTISSDLQKIVYDNPITGLNYYNLTNNENHLLFDIEHSPYWYDEYYGDPNLGPECLNFLPGDKEIYFLSTAYDPLEDYGVWIVNLAGERVWQTDAGSMSDFWQSVWRNQNCTTFLCFQENIGYGYGKLYFRQVNLLDKSEGDYKTLPDVLSLSPDTPVPVYNENFLAYVAVESNPLSDDDKYYDNPFFNDNNTRSRIVIADFTTMTPQTVLEFPYSCYLQLLTITKNGQVVFRWRENIDSNEFIIGITDKIK